MATSESGIKYRLESRKHRNIIFNIIELGLMQHIEHIVKELAEQYQQATPEELITGVLDRFGENVALATSFGAEDQVLTDMLCKLSTTPKLFTLDTGRLPQETYDVMQKTRERYGINIEVLFPQAQQVQAMVNEHGPNLFYRSVELRKECCYIRKIEPLKRKLADLKAWICGLRTNQSATRSALQPVEADATFHLIKVSPLANWTTDQVWDYIKAHEVPYNILHDQGYPSIGCAPCTRAITEGQDIRAGRWWWEMPEQKECGLHLRPDGSLGRKE